MGFVNFLKKPNLLFIVAFLLICLSYNYLQILQSRPHSLHTWRQSDCLSITLNYYQHGMKFFEPEIHNLISDNNTSGKTIGEFPLVYYFIAILWKLFGVHEWIYRFVCLLVVFWGLFSLYKTTNYFVEDNFWAIWLPLVLFTSPIFADYGISFLTNVTALCLVLVAFRHIQLYYVNNKNNSLYIAMLLFLVAGLLKISSLIGFVFLVVVFFGERISLFNKERVYLFKSLKVLVPMLLVICGISAWYWYAESYNTMHQGRYTFNNLWPIWEMSWNRIHEYLYTIRTLTIYLVFNIYTIILFVIMFLVIIFNPRRNNSFFYFGTIILLVGSIIYSLFWFQALNLHDYYYIDLLVFIMFIPFTFLVFLKKNYEKILKSKILKAAFTLLLIFNVYYTSEMLELRYFPKSNKAYSVIPSHDLVNLLKWIDSNYSLKAKALEDIYPYFEKIGIKPGDRVISIPDGSFNVTLYLMKHPGWTEYGLDKTNLRKYITRGAKYLIVNDTTLKSEGYLKPYLSDKIGTFRNVEIFRLK